MRGVDFLDPPPGRELFGFHGPSPPHGGDVVESSRGDDLQDVVRAGTQLRVQRQEAPEKGVQGGGQVGPPFALVVVEALPAQDLGAQRVDVLAFLVQHVGAVVRQGGEAQKVQDHAEGEDVRLGREVLVGASGGEAPQHLGRTVGDGARGPRGLAGRVLVLHLAKVTDQDPRLAARRVQQAVAGFEVPVDEPAVVQKPQARRDVPEKVVDLVKGQFLGLVRAAGQFGLPLGAPTDPLLELLGRRGRLGRPEDVVVHVPPVAILLQDEGAGDARAEGADLVVLEPDVPVRDEVLVGQALQQLHLDEHLFEPGVVVADGDPFARETAQVDTVQHVLDQQDDAPPAPAEFPILDEEFLKIVGRECRLRDAVSL